MLTSSVRDFWKRHLLIEDVVDDVGGGGGGEQPSDASTKTDIVVDDDQAKEIYDLMDFSEGKEEKKVEDKKEEKVDKKEDKKEEKREDKKEDKKEDKSTDSELKDLILSLQNEIKELKANKGDVKEDKKDAPVDPIEEEINKTKDLVAEFFEDDKEFDGIIEDKAAMNKVLARVQHKTIERVLRAIPAILTNTINTQVAVAMKSAEFYRENEDLVQHAKFVEEVANDLSSKNPAWTMGQIFDKLAEEVRTRKGLEKRAKKEDKKDSQDKKEKPGFAKAGSSRQPSDDSQDKRTEQEKQIDDVLFDT